jgi:hypothetical protein
MSTELETRERLDALSREAERIVTLILHTNMPRVDIDIQIEDFREECVRQFPGSDDVFEMVYAARFRRIWEQWYEERPGMDEITRAAWEEW